MLPESIRSTGWANYWASVNRPVLTSRVNNPECCPARIGCEFIIHRKAWSQAYTANVSIGQGYDLCTPLQMAMAYSVVANGGTSYYPRLVKKVSNQDGTPVLDENGKIAVPEEPKSPC